MMASAPATTGKKIKKGFTSRVNEAFVDCIRNVISIYIEKILWVKMAFYLIKSAI